MGKTNKTPLSKLAVDIDQLAGQYIISQKFTDINKLSEKDHCDKVMLLTARVLQEQLKPLEQKEVLSRIGGTPPSPRSNEGTRVEGGADLDSASGSSPGLVQSASAAGPSAAAQASVAGPNAAGPSAAQASAAGPSAAGPSAAGPSEDTATEDCIEIAKFYVKIAHLYAAIMKTVNPVITKIDAKGNRVKYDLMSYPYLPTESEIASIEHNNFCSRRLNMLMQEIDKKKEGNTTVLTVKPQRICIGGDPLLGGTPLQPPLGGTPLQPPLGGKPLMGGVRGDPPEDDDDDEPPPKGSPPPPERGVVGGPPLAERGVVGGPPLGVVGGPPLGVVGYPLLSKLYYDIYDPVVGDYTSMSDEMRKKHYEPDIAILYKSATKGDEVQLNNGVPSIKSIDEIPIFPFKNSPDCKSDGRFLKEYTGSLKDKVFQEYAKHIEQMEARMNNNQDKLFNVLHELFKFNKTDITIHPDLKKDRLPELIVLTRQLIIELYITCEADFFEGVQLLEGIINAQLAKTRPARLAELNRLAIDTLLKKV